MEFKHVSILFNESIDFLITDKNGIYVDCTMGGAGHSRGFASQLEKDGLLLGIDQDDDAIAAASERLLDKFTCKTAIAKSNFENFADVLDSMGIDQIDGIFFDLGVSSYQLDTPERGFSYMHDGPLDMRMRHDAGETAADLVARLSVAEMTTLFRELGEEKRAGAIARAIDRERQKVPFTRTLQLADCVAKAVGTAHTKGRHPATRVFQALRMAVNDEMGDLRKALEAGLELLKPGGVMAILTFESLTDRVVKQTFRAHCGQEVSLQQGGSEWRGQLPKTELIFKKAVAGQPEELEENPRARSAKLRAVRRVEG